MRRRKISFTSMSSPNPLTASSGSPGRPVISGPLPLQKRTPTKTTPRAPSTYSTASSVSRYSGESYRSDKSKATVKSSTSASNPPKTPVHILKHSVSVHSSLRTVGSARPHAGRRSLPSSSDSRRHAIVGMPSGDEDDDLDPELMSYTSFYSERSSWASDASSKRDDRVDGAVTLPVPQPRVVGQRQRCISTSTASSRNIFTRVSGVSNATSSVYSCDTDAYAYETKPLPPLPDKTAIRRPWNPITPTRKVTFASDETSGQPSTEMSSRLSEIKKFDLAPAIAQMVSRFKKIQRRVDSGEQVDLTTLSGAFSEALVSVLDMLNNIPWDIRASTSFNLAWEDILLHHQQFHKRSSLIVDDQTNLSDGVIKAIEGAMYSTKRLLDDVQEQLDSSRVIPPLPFETEDGDEIVIFPQHHEKKPTLVLNEYMPSRAVSFVASIHKQFSGNDDTASNAIERTNSMSSSIDSLSTSPTSSDSNGRASTLFSRKSSSTSESSMESFSEEVLQYLDYSSKEEANNGKSEMEKEDSDRAQVTISDFDINVPPARPRPRRKTGGNNPAVQQILENVRASMILFPELSGERQSTEFLGGIPEDEADTDEVLYGNGQNGKFLKGLSLRRIVAQICSKNSLDDADFTEMVLFCFRYWCEPEVFLQHLIDLYTMPALAKTKLWSTMGEKQQVQIRVLKIIKVWLTQFWRPDTDRSVFDTLISFAQDTVVLDFEMTAKNIIEKLTCLCCSDGAPRKRSQIRAEKAMKTFVVPIDVPRSPSTDLLRTLQDGKFESIGPLQLQKGLGASALAQQLTVMEARLYTKLDPEEILAHYILKKENSSDDVEDDGEGKSTIAERLTEHAEYTSRLTNWVSHCVLRMTEPASRAAIFSFFLNVSKKCVDFRNFSSAHSIWVGLSTYGIDRLPLTQNELSKNTHACQTFSYLTEIFDASKHFAACRELIRKSKEPAIPLIGVYRHLFNSLTETVKLFLDSNTDPSIKLINVSVCRKLSSIVQEMEATHAIYKMTGNDLVLGYLEQSFKNSPSAEILTGLCRHFRLQEEDSIRNINKLQPGILRPILDRFNSRRSQDD